MQRNMELIRSLLLKLEALPVSYNGIEILQYEGLADEKFTAAEVAYHCDLLLEAGLVDQPGNSPRGVFAFRRLTWQGHDFVDAVRDEDVWQKTRKGALAAGGWSFELIGDLAKGFIRKKASELTGVDL